MKQTKRLILLAISAVLVLGVISPAAASAHKVWALNGEVIPEIEEGQGGYWATYKATFTLAPNSATGFETVCEYAGPVYLYGGSANAEFGEPAPEWWDASDECRNPFGGNGNCEGTPTAGRDLLLGGASGWEFSEPYRLDTHMHEEEAPEEACFYNNRMKVTSSGEGGLRSKEVSYPIELVGVVLFERYGKYSGWSGNATGAWLKIQIGGAELVNVP